MFKTEFAGLTALEAGEPLSSDGYSFQTTNPITTDRLLKLGARTHRHDAHPGVNDPADAPLIVLTANGSLPPNADIAIAYTLVDTDGGETRPSPTALVTTSPPLDAPDTAPNTDFDTVGGHMTAGTYTYALTLTDPNGETTAGPPFFADIDAGTDTNAVTISGLSDLVNSVPGATGWRLYKSSSVGQLHFLAAGGASLDDVVDDGLLCADCNVTPPQANTTSVSQGIEVTVPVSVTNSQTGVVGYRIYASVGGVFSSPSYVEQRNDFGAVIDYTHIVVNPGAPPDVSTSYGGALKIDPDTELVEWHWKRPVNTPADLPEPADPGDVRVSLSDGTFWIFTNAAWSEFQAPAMNWKPAVASAGALPPLGDPGNTVGDIRVALDSRVLWLFLADGWINISAPPHEIRSDVATMPQRLGLQFMDCDVVDDAVGNQTVITPRGGGGGGGGAPGKLDMGQAVEWVDSAGTTQVSIHAERETRDDAWFTDGFNDPLTDYANQDHNVDTEGPGFLAPLPTHPLNTDVMVRKAGPSGDPRLDLEADAEQFHLHLLNFNAVGLGIANGALADRGIYVKLIQAAGVFTVDVVSRADNAHPWVVAAHHDVDPAALVADDDVTFMVRREDGSFTYGIWNETQAAPVLDWQTIPVPATVAAVQGTPAIWSNLTDVAAWNLNTLRAIFPTPVYKLYATAGESIVIIDTTGDRDWSQRGTLPMDWTWGGGMRLTPDGMGIELSGIIQKQGGANPVAGEVMFTISGEGNWSWSNSASFPCVTGDQDSDELGFVKFDSGLGAFVWQQGRSSDPATKFPYVRLDGIVIPR